MRNNNKFFQKFAAAIVQRSGIARPTVEALLPAVFDEIRYILTEGNGCIPIESFGTLTIKDVPEHQFLYNHNGANQLRTVPAKRVLKFAPTRNLRQEVEAQQFDPTRRSFVHHADDPKIRLRQDLRYRPVKHYDREKGATSRPIYKKQRTTADDTD